MKQTGIRTLKSCVSFLLALCMILSVMPMTALATEIESTEEPIVYVSIGDSMTNGYCLDGYDGTSGAINYGIDTYGNMFAAWLAGYTGSIANDQVIFTGTNGTVDHRQLSISGLRAQDIQWILNMDYADDTLMQDIFNMDYNGTGWNSTNWYNWGLYGDRYTWSEYGDYDYRYADAAARILAMYHGGNGTGYFTSSYTDEATVQKAIAGIAANPYYPQGKTQADEMGGYKYLQVATEFYQKSMTDADIISLAVGNTNFGTHMLSNITDVIMGDDMSFSTQYSIDEAMALAARDESGFTTAQVNAMLASDEFANIVAACKYLAGGDTEKENEIAYIVEYAMTHFIVGYIGMLDAIMALNPDAEIIQIALMNAYENNDGTVDANTLGALVELIYGPVNAWLQGLPAELKAAKTDAYASAKFYFAEAPYVSCMVDVFGDDYYSKDGSFVEYPGLLTGTEGYTANETSIVRDRFVEEIICGDMIFNAMGLRKLNTQANMRNFLYGGDVQDTNGNVVYSGVGAVAYDMMTGTEKAAYAAQNADAAKEYALYLAFENSLIRSGTENVTMDALAGLSNIKSAFLAFYPEVLAAIGNARANYYEAVAPVIVAGSDGALTESQVVEIMAAYEQVKSAVWAGFADYHTALASATGHTTLEHVLNCDTCMDNGGHGDGISEQLVATYNEQMTLLPYNIIAEMAKDQTGGLLEGKDIKRLCDAADYEAEVYTLVAEKSNGAMTAEQARKLVATDDGVWVVAGEISGYSASMVKMAYENGMLEPEQEEQIELLMTVREAILKLLAKDENGNFTTKATFVNNAAGISSAIDGAAQLAYLLALPKAMSDTLFNDSNMQGALCMNARCLLGTGAGGHPSVGGHTALFKAVLDAYNNVSYEWSEDYSTCTASLNGRFSETVTTTQEVTTPATCQVMGTATYTAEFNATWASTQTESAQNVPLADHHFGEWEVTKAPSCTEEGIETRTCTFGCGETETRSIATVHNYGEPEWDWGLDMGKWAATATFTCECGYSEDVIADVTTTYTEPTCQEFGKTIATATIEFNGKTYSDTMVDSSTSPVDHKFGEWMVTTEPTCTEAGEETRTCIYGCGEKETQSVPALGHSYAAVVTAPTCTEGGYTTYTCARCDDSYIADETLANGHSYGENGKCTVCGAIDPDAHPVCEYTVAETLVSGNTYILALGGTQVGSYTFTEVDGGWTIQAADGTYLAIEDEALVNSTTAFTWTYSNGSFSATVETKSSNNWWGGWLGNWWGSSEETYYLVASGSGTGISTSATGSEAIFYTAHSDYSHNFNAGAVTAPTCTEGGYTTYTCDRCGYSYTGAYTEALGHSYEAAVTAPTCTEDGSTTYTCSTCGDSYVDSYVEALGHNYVDGVCTNCGHDTNKPVEPEIPEGECAYLAEQTLTSGGSYILSLGGNQVGTYTFTQVDGGWTIQAADGTYLALENKALVSTSAAFTWTYSNGYFSTTVETESTGNNWWGGWLGNWWGSGSSEETYYLVSSGSNVTVSTSTSAATAKFYLEVTGEHVYGDPIASNGSHLFTCINCGNTESMSCSDEDCQLCHPAAKISVSVDVTSKSSGNKWWGNWIGNWWGSGSSTTYTATITVNAEGTEVESVAYSTDGGNTWTTGTSFTSSSEITAFNIRVIGTNGVTYFFVYNNGTVTQVG